MPQYKSKSSFKDAQKKCPSNLKKARDQFRKEREEHRKDLEKDQKEYQKSLLAQEGLDETYDILCRGSGESIPCKKLKIAMESWQEEIQKYWKFIVLVDAFKKGTPMQDMYRAIQKGVEDAYYQNCQEVNTGQSIIHTLKDSNQVHSIESTDFFESTPEGVKATLLRAGSEFGDMSRGGTWYVVKKYEGQRISYEKSPYTLGVIGVGGKEVWEKTVVLKNPFYIDITDARSEAYFPLEVIEKVFGKKRFEYYETRVKGKNAEKWFAKAELEARKKLEQEGYDSIVFYYTIGVHTEADQVFLFNKSENNQ